MKELPVTYQELRKIFTNRSFIKRLSQAADTTLKSGWESGFQVAKDPKTRTTYYGEVPESAYCENPEDELDMPEFYGFEKAIAGKYSSQDVLCLVIDLHTHKMPSKCHPSEDDLNWLTKYRMLLPDEEFNTPMMGIISFPNKKALDLLLIQETREKAMGNVGVEWAYDYITSQENYIHADNQVIQDICDYAPNLRADLLRYQRTIKGRYEINPEDLDKLARFAYTARV